MPTARRQLIWATLGSICVVLAGCNANAPVALQPSDLQATRLSAAERLGYSRDCRKTWNYAPQNRFEPAAKDAKVERDFKRVCDCFVERLEDRTNKLEFMIAMQVIRALSSPYGDAPNFKELATGATKIGMSEARFQETVTEASKTGGAAILYCTEKVASHQ